MRFKEFLKEQSFNGTHSKPGELYKKPGASHGPKPPRSVLAAFTDEDGYTVSIVGQVQQSEDFFGRTGVTRITAPDDKMIKGGYWMNWPEKEWNISEKEWKKMSWEDRAALEVKQQATKYSSLEDQFAHYSSVK